MEQIVEIKLVCKVPREQVDIASQELWDVVSKYALEGAKLEQGQASVDIED